MSTEPADTPPATDRAALDPLHHVAIVSKDVAGSVRFYRDTFRCEVSYQDETWALLKFRNISLALVNPDQHPPHLGFVIPNAAEYGTLEPHRDGTESLYIEDPSGNAVELLSTKGIDDL